MSASSHWWTDADVATLRSFGVAMKDKGFPGWLITVMSSESGCLPDPHHNNAARGLIQFVPGTLKALGYKGAPDEFAAQGVGLQLPWVLRYFRNHAGKIHSLADTYVCNFLPAYTGMPEDYVLCAADSPRSWAYKSNAGFDAAKKGFITPGDLALHARSALARCEVGLDLIARLVELQGPPSSSSEAPVPGTLPSG